MQYQEDQVLCPKDAKSTSGTTISYILLTDEECLANALELGVATSNSLAYQTEAAEKSLTTKEDKYYELLNKINENTSNTVYQPLIQMLRLI